LHQQLIFGLFIAGEEDAAEGADTPQQVNGLQSSSAS